MKILLWVENGETELFQKSATIIEKNYGNIDSEAFTSNGNINSCVVSGKELKHITKEDIQDYGYDLILVVGKNVNRQAVLKECNELGVDVSRVVFDFEVCIPGFSIEKSNRLHRSRISILSINDFGNKLYQRFQLPYFSPFVESVMTSEDWLIYLESPQKYLFQGLSYLYDITNVDGTKIPVFQMGDSKLKVYMFSGKSVEQIQRDWVEWAKRINWLDVVVIMYTDSPDILNRFDRLPYGKKICFTSFESHLDSAFYLPKEVGADDEEMPLWERVDNLVKSAKPYYDLWDMLLYGRRTHI